jgi:hypothetical protein
VRRRGVSAIELVISSAIMAAVFLPLYTLVRSNQQVAYLSEFHVLARRVAYRALSRIQGHRYRQIAAAATGDPPPAGNAALPDSMRRVLFQWPSPEEEAGAFGAPGAMLDGYEARMKGMEVRVYFETVDQGFGRLAAHVQWKDPTSKSQKSFVAVRFVQAPFHFMGAR